MNQSSGSCLKSKFFSSSPAFTIVELLVVIVVIGILAAITIISYTGITSRANMATVQSDLSNASTQLKLYQTMYGSYPISLDGSNCPKDASNNVDANYCLKASPGNTLVYSTYHNLDGTDDPQNFGLSVKNNSASYSNNANDIKCPLGFIVVPGSATYNTSDFCAMKYEAKRVGSSSTPISTATGLPWVSISQTTAIANSPNVADCTGCHLITEAEWMTIAQNVLSVASNWSGAAVGTGYIPRGNSSSSAATDATSDLTGVNKRTLTLTNNEVIWDMAGNVYEWTNATIAGNAQPGLIGDAAYGWKQWNNGSLLMNGLPYNSQPASTGIAGITWNSSSGVGQLYSNYGDATARAFLRGGMWGNWSGAGVLHLYLNNSAGSTDTSIGFRVSR